MKPSNFILSIKPEYALQIIEGKKTVELRRKFPIKNICGGVAIIYASSPMQKIIGYAYIVNVQKLPVSRIWDEFNKSACISKAFFNSYFNGLSDGFAIELGQPIKLHEPIDIKELEAEYSFYPPQSYQYASEKILEAVDV